MTAKKREEPGFVERAIDGLEDHFERGEQGEETGFERPDVEQEREERDPQPNAEQFQHLTERAEQQKVEKREEQELYQRWKTKLKSQEFGLSAKILDFPDGFPGDAGLFLTWNR